VKSIWQLLLKLLPYLSLRGRIVLLCSGVTQIALTGLDAVALLILASVFRFTNDQNAAGIAINATASSIILIIGLFVIRSVLSSVVSWITITQLTKEEAQISVAEFSKLLRSEQPTAGNLETQFQNNVDRAPEALLKIISSIALVVSETVTALVLLGIFLKVDSLTAVLAVLYFTTVVTVQHRFLADKIRNQGYKFVGVRNELYRILNDAANLRKILLCIPTSSLSSYLREYRSSLARIRGRIQFLQTVPRYLLELTLALGIALIGGVRYLTSGPTQALAAIVLFAGVSFRILPSVNQIQTLILLVLGNLPTAELLLSENHKAPAPKRDTLPSPESAFDLIEVGFQYLNSNDDGLLNINLSLKKGKQYALVGPSGAGKTTLVDLLLGVLVPSTGDIRRALDVTVFYVPQETHIANLPLAENIAMSWDPLEIDRPRIESSLREAGLTSFLNRLNDPMPLDSDSLSGGEKQRIGLARAFYSEANFIVFDEVTSSLDSELESAIVNQILELRGRVTSLIISHRLTTVQQADDILYLSKGRLIGTGTYRELVETLPEFRRLVELDKMTFDA